MKKLLSFFLILPIVGFSQENTLCSVKGKVMDEKTNQPLQNVSIMLENKNIGTTSDMNGFYKLENIEPNHYMVIISSLGYKTERKVIELKKHQQLELNIKLLDSIFSIQEMEIVASNTKSNRGIEVPQRINKIEAKSIITAPVRNISELLDYVPSSNMSNTLGIYSSSAVITMRGMPSNNQSRTLIVLDGVPQNKSDQGSVNWNKIDKNNIEQITVIKGPGSAKYGSGAMGGVIELTSKKPQKPIEGSTIFEYGTYNTKSLNLNLGGKIKLDSISKNNFYWRTNSFGRKSDGYIAELSKFIEAEDTFLVPVYLEEMNFNTMLGYTSKNNQNIEVQTNYYDDKRGNGIKVFESLGTYSTHQTLNFIGSYSGSTKNFEWSYKLFTTTENFIKQYESMIEGEYRLYEANVIRNDLGTKADLKILKFNNHEIESGVNFSRGIVDGSDIYYTSTDKITNKGKMDTYSFYLQDAYFLLNKKLQLNYGIRYDITQFYDAFFQIEEPSYSMVYYENFSTSNDKSKQWQSVNPKFSIQYIFSSNTRFFTSVAKGFRSPILDDLTRNGRKKGTFKLANPDLKPENLTSFEVGFDMVIAKKSSIAASTFYSVGYDFMYLVSTGDSVNMGYRKAPLLTTNNISKVEIVGTELEYKYEVNNQFSYFINVSYTKAQIKEHQINNTKVDSNLTNKYLTDVPDFKIGSGVNWRNKILNCSMLFKYVGKTWVNEMNSIDPEIINTAQFGDYSILSLKIDKTIKEHINISLSMENIFDRIYMTSDIQKNPGRLVTGALKLYF